MSFLTGEYDHQIDAKNRIRIPGKLRGKEEQLFFTKGTDGCIFAFYKSVIEEKLAKLEAMKMNDSNPRKGLRSFSYSIKPVDIDQNGRLVIPQELVKYANIVKDVKVCGAVSRIEIWAKEVYDKYFEHEDEEYDENFSLLDI